MNAEFPLAVHALVYLRHTGKVVSSGRLAENICTNPARVRKVMAALCRAGLAESARGKGSGYLSAPGSGEITLRGVLEALDEAPISMNWRSGDMDRECLLSSGMGAVMDGLYAGLNETCLRQLEAVTIASIERQIFEERRGAE